MPTRSRQIRIQMGGLLVVAVLLAVVFFVLKPGVVVDAVLGDPRPLLLNGVIVVLFGLGIWQLDRGLRRYETQERQIADFLERRETGAPCGECLPPIGGDSLLADRYDAIRRLFERGGPVDHGAISAVMVAEESLHQSFPRFVNNVLILLGVFGTVSSLIFALVGATHVLEAAAPGEGMGLLLLGMNTALTTTATAIVCYFFFTFFYHRFADLQTWVLGQIERAALLHMAPEFSFEADVVNRQTKILLEDVRSLVVALRDGLGGVEQALARHDQGDETRQQQLAAMVEAQAAANRSAEQAVAKLAALEGTLVEGFRLARRQEG